jgi:transcription-repair coupling factor (superfamily II helicase)
VTQSLPTFAIGITRTLSLVAFPAQAQVLITLVRETEKPVVHIVPQDKDVAALAAICRFLAPDIEVLQFPAWDTLPYDRVSPAAAILSQRLSVLGRLCQYSEKPYILLTTLNAASQKLPPKRELQTAHFIIRKGAPIERERLLEFLNDYGYRRSSKVMEAGEFAVRGSLIDLFPAGSDEGVRIDWFGDEVESLKRFDPLTQISAEPLESLTLLPVSEVMLNTKTVARFRENYLQSFGAVTRDNPLYEAVSQSHIYAGMEHWLPLFYDSLDSLADYTPGAILSMDQRVPALHRERSEAIADYFNARQMHLKAKNDGPPYHPVPIASLFLNHDELLQQFDRRPQVTMTPFAVDGATPLELKSAPQLFSRRHAEGASAADVAIEFIASSKKPVIIAANSFGSADRIAKLLKLGAVETSPLGEVGALLGATGEGNSAITQALTRNPKTDFDLSQGRGSPATTSSPIPNPQSLIPTLTVLPIEQGFETPNYLLLSEQDIFGERIIRTTKKKRPSEAFMQEAASFSIGEYIVHQEHGIGRYEGLITVEVTGTRHDCLKLIYDGGTLFLPVENIDLVSRYGATDGEIALDKLGGVAWQKRKSAMKKRLKMAAEALMKVAAERAAKIATAFSPEAGLYDEFVRRFPYTETEDQLTAIDDVRADLNAGRAMDRLICGDVGFGKTEVALRAAFIAASGGAQVAVIAPTTLLARQHYYNFVRRFEGMLKDSHALGSSSPLAGEARWGGVDNMAKTGQPPSPTLPAGGRASLVARPFTIRMLSRLTTTKEAAQTRLDLAEGKVDIVVGTHALLSANVQFKNLELLIVDEEQHFGVTQKEKLKSLKTDIHVLTLSATPIPRTLQMALSGVRELSLITTPPIDRLAVRTYVMPVDWVIIREALLREYHRGGKSFYVTPRIKYMDELQVKLREHLPELKVAVAHGQLGAQALDTIMNEFYDGKYDVLLSTAIIESGIDVPTANTMIIDRAQLFGLSQLYQLRGRVGRSKTRAYAYFTLPHHQLLARDAQRRLEVMQQLDSLGAGFSLASHDMDIRGFGNLLGEEQSGHIREVGMELYQAMLEEAIADLRRRKKLGEVEELADSWSPQINLGMSVLIPENYIEDLSLRLSLYRRAGALDSAEMLESFAGELIDRFGALPVEVEHLLAVLRIKIICKTAGIVRLDAGPKGIVLAFRQNKFANPEALIGHIAKHANRIKLRADQTLFVAANLDSETARLSTALAVAHEIAGL